MPTPIPQRRRPGRQPARHPAPGAFDLNAACAGFCYGLAAAADAVARRAGPATCWWSAPRSSPTGSTRTTGRRRSSSPTAPAPRSSARPYAEEVGIGPVAWGSAGESADLITIDVRDASSSARRARRCSAGRPPRSPRSRSRPASRPGSRRPSWPRSSRTRRTCASSRPSPASSARPTPGSPTTSSSRATHPRRRSRWRWPGWPPRGEVRSGDPVLLLGFGAGLTYAGQVVLCP